eukprot:TRINITY_DN1549_c0_g1_i1.p1 TRINITY_DN1549_c0_g1~~TRINITY_DN1549_c0_g1_i1.p1  ORF type:complete len:296 (+),score=82.90 TRINITY_DN1549_c0_g1_i1:66-953(+)
MKVAFGVLFFFFVSCTFATLPVVMWHGMGDTCCNPLSLGRLQKVIEAQIPGVYVHSIKIGKNEGEDAENGFLMNINKQVDIACAQLANDTKLAGGFNAVGFSQGSQFLRAYVQRCNKPPIKNLISVGGQHQGVFGFPRCLGENVTLCDYVRKLLNLGAYIGWIQNHLAQAEYWQDPFNMAEYEKYSVFLADINNQKATKNPQYKQNLLTLNNFVLVKFLKDSMVQPRESEWFGFYKPGQDKEIIDLRDSDLYKQDWLGLQQLDKQGKLKFLEVDGDHLQFSEQWFIDNVITPYFK